MDKIIFWLEQNLTLIGTIIIPIILFTLKQLFDKHKKSSSVSIKTKGPTTFRGDIIGRDKNIYRTENIIKSDDHNLDSFLDCLKNSEWHSDFVDNNKMWFCNKDIAYKIEISNKLDNYTASWAEKYPNETPSKTKVYLSINGTKVKELIFILLDGGNLFVPLPDTETINEQLIYYWDKESLKYNVGKIIGLFNSYGSLEAIAERSNIEIR